MSALALAATQSVHGPMASYIIYVRRSYKEATVEYLKTAYLFRNYTAYAAEAQFLAGKSCEAYKQMAEAKNAYKRTKEFFATTLWAAEADKRLDELKDK